MLGPRLHRTRVQSSGGDVECGPLACIRLNTGNSTYFERMKRFFRFRLEFHLFTVAQNTPLQLKSNVKCVQSVKSYFSTSLVSLLRLKQFEGIVFAPSKMSFWMRCCWEAVVGPSSHHPSPTSLTILSFYPGSYMYVKSILRQMRLIASIEHLRTKNCRKGHEHTQSSKLLVAGCGPVRVWGVSTFCPMVAHRCKVTPKQVSRITLKTKSRNAEQKHQNPFLSR